MIRDYKLTTPTPRRRRKNGRLVLLAFLVLAGTGTAVKYLDPQAFAADQEADSVAANPTEGQPLTLPLALPTTPPAAVDRPVSNEQADDRQVAATRVSPQAVQLPALPETVLTGVADDVAKTEQAPSLLALVASPTKQIYEQATEERAEAPVAVVEPEPSDIQPPPRWVEHRVTKGESLARIFSAQGLEPALLHRIVNSDKLGKKLARIRPGQTFRFRFDDDDLTRLELHRNRVESIRVAITDDAIKIDEVSKDVEKRIGSAAGMIESSLFVDAQEAGMSDGQIMELAEIFGWDIDFALEIRAGDQFRVLYEEHYLDGEKLRDGPILAAEFTNRGQTHTAVRYEDKNGDVGYYDVDGASKRRAFIRTPIKFARVSSRYNPRRWHPVLKKWRSHKGVDYAAPTGTPIKATGDGRVVFRGRKSGYGKTVIIEHAGKYTTLYAHMNGYSKRSAKGKRVKQGQVIGYVGKTGLATGPHLHYEFRVNGRHRDPLRVKLPKSLSLAKSELATFRKQTAPLLTQLAAIPSATMVASANPELTH